MLKFVKPQFKEVFFSEGIVLFGAEPRKLSCIFQKRKLGVMKLRTFDPFYGGNPIKARRYLARSSGGHVGQGRESRKDGNWNICAAQAFAQV